MSERHPVWATGAKKDALGQRLLADWTRLANQAEIPAADRARFERGRESDAIWEWLEARGRLGELPDLLRASERADLARALEGDGAGGTGIATGAATGDTSSGGRLVSGAGSAATPRVGGAEAAGAPPAARAAQAADSGEGTHSEWSEAVPDAPVVSDAPKVFISYSHDSPEHADRVLAFSDRLRNDGVDSTIDQYDDAPAEGWPRWMARQLAEARFVLVVCTETYTRRVELREEPGKGHGVMWESNIIFNSLYAGGSVDPRFIPVLFRSEDARHIPMPLQGVTHYEVHGDDGYEKLYRRLTRQPGTLKPKIGQRRVLPPRERKSSGDAGADDGDGLPGPAVHEGSEQPNLKEAVGDQATIDSLPLDAVPAPAPLPSGSLMPLSTNPLFVGRDAELRELARLLKAGETAAITPIAAATTGIGGIGKTQLAVEFVHRYGQYFAGGVFWLSFANADAVGSQVAACGSVGRMNLSPHFKDLTHADQVQLVRAAWQEAVPRLLVFDNCEEEALLDEW